MAEFLEIANGDKEAKYQLLFKQIFCLTEYEKDAIAVMANVSAMIHQTFDFLWTGFYRVVSDELILGPFQGPLACSRISYGEGVCGTAWKEGHTMVVDDVDKFPGHIACSSASKSEIVVPIKRNDKIVGVIDVDSEKLSAFDETDAKWLEKIAEILPM